VPLLSTESKEDLQGEIYAVVNYPFPSVSNALNNANNWCDALILHVNVKYCHASGGKLDKILKVNIGKKMSSHYRKHLVLNLTIVK
jgi:hypothetical protein